MAKKSNVAYKFRIYPTKEQQVLLAKTFGCVRYVYNYFLFLKKSEYENNKNSISYTQCASLLSDLKKSDEFLKEVDSIALQQSLRHLDTAFQNFFKKPGTGYPKFKKRKYAQSYSSVLINNNIRIQENHIKLPKIGFVRIKLHRNIPDEYILKSVTISRNSIGKYYISLLFEFEQEITPITEINNSVGLDYSMHELFVSSDGVFAYYPKFYRKTQDKLAREQRKLSHCKKYSNNYYKQKKRVAKIHENIANQRKDFLHKLSREITNLYDCVCIEDLNVQGMSRALNFGKSVHDNGWGMFTTMLQYKLEFEGKYLIKIDKFFPSSQLCNNCGYQNSNTKDLSLREWTCPVCNTHHNRDINAAINIKNEGLRLLKM